MFSDWLNKELKERDWIQADLARASGLTTASISRYMIDRIPDKNALKKIARALKVPPEEAFRAADILPPTSIQDQWVRRIEHKLEQITDESDRRTIEGMIDLLSPDKKVAGGRSRAKSEST